ncbi:hypothetical protein IFR05_006824 [Cadophora sp. M221]|nr:hypothetical protein IFR05_006824 [Cadophora sp. M221]
MASPTNFGSYSFHQSQLFDCTTMPRTYTGTPPTKGWWNCCQCHREVNPETHGYTCPDCANHPKCDSCTTNTHGPTPANDHLDFGAQTYGRSDSHGSVADHHEHSQHSHDLPVNYMPNAGYDFTKSDPSMEEFWKCCQCSEKVNSEWAGLECTACNHVKCDYCTPVS